jgi:hypothetical protein
MLFIRTFWVCLILVFVICGCSHHPTDAEFTHTAHDFIATKYSWADKATYDVKRDGTNWTVTVHPPTSTPEGKQILFIEIDRNGKIVSFI